MIPGRRQQASVVTFRWDLDKTYLKTQFESFSKLVRIPFERAADKTHLPGVPELVRGLRRTAVARGEQPRVLFLTATPPQLASAIREKLEADGVEIDGIVFKDQLHRLVRGRLRELRDHVAYKLEVLLESRLGRAVQGVELLFGDDWESDALVYTIYAEWLAGRLDGQAMGRVLSRMGVPAELALALAARAAMPVSDPEAAIERIYIHLERRTPLAGFRAYGGRLLPTFSPFQAALDLFARKRLDDVGLVEVAAAVAAGDGTTARGLMNLIDDLVRRGHLDRGWRARSVVRLGAAGVAGLGRADWRERFRARLPLRSRVAPEGQVDWQAVPSPRDEHRRGESVPADAPPALPDAKG